MKITCSHQGRETVFTGESEQIVIGRPVTLVAIQLDLTPDKKVSRPHARIWVEYGQHWIEDLNSTLGNPNQWRRNQRAGPTATSSW